MLKTPPLQTATATIDTLCGRLQSATLLEDRRAAILGLRSFAKQFPASVASGSLRELIATLKRDGLGETVSANGQSRHGQEGGDVDTIRLILETLLMLFKPDSNSPEAGDEINFFMADEFSMREDNIILLLSLLDPTSPYADYYSRLYSIQLLSAICAARPERLQECILSAPLGVSRLVGALDDGRDAVRNAGLLLLIDLTTGANEELRKIVAFEDVFGRVFSLIRQEGGLAEAGIAAQDCLSLLANLIRGSSSNQAMFRESGCVTQYVQLLQQAFPSGTTEAVFVTENREKGTWGLLEVLRLFFVSGDVSTMAQNQTAFFRAGAAQLLIDLSFSTAIPSPIRTSAFKTAAVLIEGNAPLQEHFASLTIAADAEDSSDKQSQQKSQLNGSKTSARPSAENRRTYIIEALLDLALAQGHEDLSLRMAACTLIQAYLAKHDRIKAHFLQRAIAGHSESEEPANALIYLLHPPSGGDPIGIVLASWIIQDLIVDNPDAKLALAEVREGNESEGEDVLTSIQAFGSQLLISLQQQPVDEKVMAAYASLLITFLWDFAPGVDDFLAEGSSVIQGLLNVVKINKEGPIVTGIAAFLLGTVYEFSTKDSPIPRRTLAPLLQQKLGRAKYLDALSNIHRQPSIRYFDLNMEVDEIGDGMLGRTFVDFFSFEYSRMKRAIDKDPGIEVLPQSAAEAGVVRDVLDDLRKQLQSMKEDLEQSKKDAFEAGQKGDQDRMTVAKELQTSTAEVDRLRKINQSIQQGHESELAKLKTQQGAEIDRLGKLNQSKQQEHENELVSIKKAYDSEAERLSKQHETELDKLRKQHDQQRQSIIAQHQRSIAEARQEVERQSQATLRDRDAASAQRIQDLERKIAELGNAHRTEANGHALTRQQLESFKAKHAEELQRLRSDADGELAVAKSKSAKHAEELQRLHDGIDKELQATKARAAQVEDDLEKARALSETRSDEIKELQEELKARNAELKAERAGFADLEKELETAKSAAAAAASTAKPSKANNKRITELEAEMKDVKESEKSAKEDLESMLLVMSDLEAKRDAYKAKIKELGGEVTDDDEDEDEDEEEDDEEDNEESDVD